MIWGGKRSKEGRVLQKTIYRIRLQKENVGISHVLCSLCKEKTRLSK